MKIKLRPRCFFDIDIGRSPAGRVVFELFDDICPKTAENFRVLCTGDRDLNATQKLHYLGSLFHRVIKGFMIQSGDFTENDGSGGVSIYGGKFEDENLTLLHDKPFLLSMANCGPNTNGSQFFVTTKPTPHLDGKHVVFGRVVSGENLIESIENLPVGENSKPIVDATISNCGELVPVIKKKKKQQKEKEASADSNSSKDRKKKKSKKKKKNKKKAKALKKTEVEEIIPNCSVRPDEIPEVPRPFFLYRGNLKEESKLTTDPTETDIKNKINYQTASERQIDKSGRTTKGRGKLRYQPSPDDRSLTPPHWRKDNDKKLTEELPSLPPQPTSPRERSQQDSWGHNKPDQRHRDAAYPPRRENSRSHKRTNDSVDLDNEIVERKPAAEKNNKVDYRDLEKLDMDHDSRPKNDKTHITETRRHTNRDSRVDKRNIVAYDEESDGSMKNHREVVKKETELSKRFESKVKDRNLDSREVPQLRTKRLSPRKRSSSPPRKKYRPPRSCSRSPARAPRRRSRSLYRSPVRIHRKSRSPPAQQRTKSPPAHLVEKWKSRRQQIRNRHSPLSRRNDRIPHRHISRSISKNRRRSSRHSHDSRRPKRSSGTVDSSPSSTRSSVSDRPSRIDSDLSDHEKNINTQCWINDTTKQPNNASTKKEPEVVAESKETDTNTEVAKEVVKPTIPKEPVLILKSQEKPWIQNQWKTEDPEEVKETQNVSVLAKLKEELKAKGQPKLSSEKPVTETVETKKATPPISQSISKFRSPSGTRSVDSSSSSSKSRSSRSRSRSRSRSDRRKSYSRREKYRRSRSRSDRSRRYRSRMRSRSRSYGRRRSTSRSYSRSTSRSRRYNSSRRYKRRSTSFSRR